MVSNCAGIVNDKIRGHRIARQTKKAVEIRPHHVLLVVPDIEASVARYRDVLDFAVVARNWLPWVPNNIALLRNGDFNLELYEIQNASTAPEPIDDFSGIDETVGVKHIALSVNDRRKLTEKLKSKGAKITREVPDGMVSFARRRAAESLVERFAGNTLSTTGHQWTTCIPRQLGVAAAFLGRHEEASKYYQQAIKVCTEMRFRPDLALTRLQLAELLLDHYPNQRKDAIEHLDFAIKEFREMKMQPSLERALRRKEILKA